MKAIFVLSGDANFYQTGEKTGIPYSTYHNYFRQQLLSGTPWAKSVFKFFNDALFPDTSSSVTPSGGLAATVDDDLDWEAEFERAFADNGPPLTSDVSKPTSVAPGPPSISAPIAAVAAPDLDAVIPRARPIPASIAPTDPGPGPTPGESTTIPREVPSPGPADDILVGDDRDNDSESLPAVLLRPPPKAKGGAPKTKRKGKAINVNDGDADTLATSATLTARRSGRATKQTK